MRPAIPSVVAIALTSACGPQPPRAADVVAPPAVAATEPARPPLVVAAPDPDPPRPAARVAVASSDDGRVTTRGCGATRVPPQRRGGGLVVSTPAPNVPEVQGARLRTDTRGTLTAGSQRTWAGRDVPAFVPLTIGTRELFLLDDVEDGLLALYRDPYGASSCTLGANDNCAVEVRLYACDGALRFHVAPSDRWSRPDRLELQDVRWDGGVVYYNEACQSYSREAAGACSRLVALDPIAQKVLWRSAPLRSNGRFLVRDRYLVTGYGFTAEPDALFVLRRSDGATVSRAALPSQHQELTIEGDVIVATVYPSDRRAFRMVGFDGDQPKLTPLPAATRGSVPAERPPKR